MNLRYGRAAQAIRRTITEIRERRTLGKKLRTLCLEDKNLEQLTRTMNVIEKCSIYSLVVRPRVDNSGQAMAVREELYNMPLSSLIGILAVDKLRGLVEFFEEQLGETTRDRLLRDAYEKKKSKGIAFALAGIMICFSSVATSFIALAVGDFAIVKIGAAVTLLALGSVIYGINIFKKLEKENKEHKFE